MAKVGSVLIVGGGVAGIQASLDLSELGYKVYLIENNPSIGGIMGQLDKTFPTLDCSMCILAPKMVEVGRDPNIELITYSQVEKVDGQAGNFEVTLLKKARYIDADKCKACGICHEHCPIAIKDEYNMGLGIRTAIYTPFPQAVPSTYVVDKETCLYLQDGICQICEKVCEVGAVDHNQKDEQVKINVGAIILAVGTDTFDPSILPQYGYGKIKNVVTSLEFERILNASGPFKGHVVRPLDMKHPHKILWLNCIGSRNTKIDKGYCSAVCCMYTIKQALIAMEHAPDLKCHVCYIDMRTVGKGFEEFYVRGQNSGIKFFRGRVSMIQEDPHTGDIIANLENTETGEMVEEKYDLVVLSIGLTPFEESPKLAETFGITLDKYNFAATGLTTPLETSKPGIYVCGTYSGPKDIPETVAEASGAAGKASTLLTDVRKTLITKKEYPPELEIGEFDEPRIGAFICHCGINIGGVVGVPKVVEYTKTLPNVVYAEENLYTCSADTQEIMKEKIKEHKLNRVVVASCTPRTHEPLFQNTIREAGLNPFLFEFVNLREQCSWVHMSEPEAATEKAKELVAMGVAKASLLNPIQETMVDIKHSGLVIGGGIGGMTAALELANQGYQTFLIEKEKDLGGLVRDIHYLIDGSDPQKYLNDLINQVKNHDKIKVYTSANIDDIQGFVGNFVTTVSQNGTKDDLDSGVIIVATGGKEYKPKEFEYGKSDKILTQHELETKIAKNQVSPNSVVMIQCVGSRNDERPYCSKICCSLAIKNALKLKEKNPNTNIVVLYRDLRAYGFKEDYYREAREKGVIFIRFEKESPPEVSLSNGLTISVKHALLNQKIELNADLLVLSAAFIPTECKELSQMLKVPLEANGFFLEAHVKLRPLDFATDGVFLCGGAQWPKLINETIVQAKGAAARSVTVLAKDQIKVGGVTAFIDQDLCVGCETCIKLCPFGAIRKNEDEQVEVIGAVCKGCGVCCSSCPASAVTIRHFTTDQLISQIFAIKGGK